MSKEAKEYNRRLKKVGKHIQALRSLGRRTNPQLGEKIQEELDVMDTAVARLQAVSIG